MASRKRSLAWLYFDSRADLNKAVCLLCMETIQHCDNTSNMLRHLRAKHKDAFADVEAKRRQSEGPTGVTLLPEVLEEAMGVKHSRPEEEVKMEDLQSKGDYTPENESMHLSGASSKRSGVWTYYQEDDDGQRALCLICLSNLQHGRNTSNLLKHLQRRHPAEYATVEDQMRKRHSVGSPEMIPQSAYKWSPSQDSECRNAGKYPDILEVLTVGQSEEVEVRRALEQESRVLQRERELTEQLRRAQEQEARALEKERQLTERLQRAHEEEVQRTRDREERALQRERELIDQLRRAQEREARTLEKERELTEQLQQAHKEEVRRAQEARVLERERELTEQLRRAQEQEARALEREWELTEQLRRTHKEEVHRVQEQEARALEREKQAVEQLRRAQEQEARAIEREREALELLRRELDLDRRSLQRQTDNLHVTT